MAASACSLPEYRRIVSAWPRPLPEQVDDFVKYVSDARSWYKHLPLLPPGELFFFFLNPVSGYDTVDRPDGSTVHLERTEKSPRFHHTWMTTNAYRARFGHLAYATNTGTMFRLRTSNATYEYEDLPEFSTVETRYHLPPEVAAVGSVELTGVINRLAPRTFVWTTQGQHRDVRLLSWLDKRHAVLSSVLMWLRRFPSEDFRVSPHFLSLSWSHPRLEG